MMPGVENEYGSYGEEQGLPEGNRLMEERGVTCPLFTDGPWRATLRKPNYTGE